MSEPCESVATSAPARTVEAPAVSVAVADLGEVAGEQRAAALEALAHRADQHAAAARSARTRAAYAGDWDHFWAWCRTAGREALPATPGTVRLYLTDLETARTPEGEAVYAPATLERRLAAIAAAHKDAAAPSPTRDPTVTAVLTGIRRARARAPHRMRPLLLEDLTRLLERMDFTHWPTGITAARDAFVLLAGFAGALRRSELAALQLRDLTWHPADGLHLRIRSSKTDQEAAGATVVLPYGRHPGTCPPCAALRWLRLVDAATSGRPALMRAMLEAPSWIEQTHLYPHPLAEEQDNADASTERDCRAPAPELPGRMPLLRRIRKGGALLDTAVTGDALHIMIQRRAAEAGLPGPIGFHSLRAGFVTTARRAGADHRAVRRQTRHGSDAMVELYDREHTPLAGNAVTQLGL